MSIFDRFTSMEARPEMWASTREAFGLQLLTFAEMFLWPHGEIPRDETNELMRRLFGPGPVVSTDPIDVAWASKVIATVRAFIEERRPSRSPTVTRVHYDAKETSHGAYHDLLKALGGTCRPEIVGWCELSVDGFMRDALIVTQAWPFLPLGVDPRSVIAAKKYVGVISEGGCFRFIEVPPPSNAKESP